MPPLIQKLFVENFTAFHKLEWNKIGQLNVIAGVNGTGKTHLLKAMYLFIKAIEEANRSKETKDGFPEMPYVSKKVLNLFGLSPLEINKLIHNEADFAKVELSLLSLCKLDFDLQRGPHNGIGASFTPEVFEKNQKIYTAIKTNFIPTKEVLSIFPAITETREGDKRLNAFDDTYYDLMTALRLPTDQNPDKSYRECFPKLTDGGRVEYDYGSGEMLFIDKDGKSWFMHQIAEGVRKAGTLDRLLKNHRIREDKPDGQVLFIDEPETSLHPEAIIRFAEVLHEFAQAGIQIFLTTHSYFMLKRLEQLSKEHQTDYNLLDLRRDDNGRIQAQESLLKEGLPDNPIIEQSVQLYYKDVDLALGSEG